MSIVLQPMFDRNGLDAAMPDFRSLASNVDHETQTYHRPHLARSRMEVAMSLPLRLVVVLCALLLAPHVLAHELAGRVVGVRDGDTIDVLIAATHQVRVRLAGIDAPENGQAFARAARAALSNIVFGKPVTVHWRKRDRYGRIVGKVVADGIDANLRMIEMGLAWHDPRFADEQSAAERARYSRAESAARARAVGLWRDSRPVPPWEFRQRKAMGG